MVKIGIALSLVLLLNVAGCADGEPARIAVGERAPNFELQNLDGESVSLRDFRGSVVLLNFWATWCRPCVFEMPYLQQIHQELSSKGLVTITVNVGENDSKVKGFLIEHSLSLPIVLDSDLAIAKEYQVNAIPTTFFIDGDGVFQEIVIGAFPDKAAIEQRLNRLIE